MPIAYPDADLELLQADARSVARLVLLIDPQLEAVAPLWLK